MLCGRYHVCRSYLEDTNARVTFFAPVNDVFLYNPDLRAMTQAETLAHIGTVCVVIFNKYQNLHIFCS